MISMSSLETAVVSYAHPLPERESRTTLEELVAVVSELAADEQEAAAVIDHLFATGRVRLAALESESMAARTWH